MAKAVNANVDLESMLAKLASTGAEEKLGFKIPTSWAAAKNFVVGGGAAVLSERGAKKVAAFAERIAYSSTQDKEKSAVIGRMAEGAWRRGVPFLPVIFEAGKNYQKTLGEYFGLGAKFSTSLTSQGKGANFFNAVNSDLEIVRNERARLSNTITNHSKSMFIHAASTLPTQIGTQLDSMIEDLEVAGVENSTEPNKKPTDLSEKATQIRVEAAGKINQGFSNVLKTLSDDRGNYNIFANVGASFFTKYDLKDLEQPTKRALFLSELKSTYFGPVVSGASASIRKLLSAKLEVKTDKELQKTNAAMMVDALSKHLKKNPSPIELSLTGCSKKGCSLEDYILDIFAQHQKDSGRAEIPRRMQGRLGEAAEQIAEAIRDPNRQMKADALVFLVDKKHGIASFTKGEMTEVLHGQELDAHLAKLQQKRNMSRRHKQKVEKQYKHMQATPEHFRQSWGNLTSDEKFMWSSFLTDEILADMGVSKQERGEMRHQSNEFWRETMEEFLVEMSQLSSSQLKSAGLNDSQVNQLTEAVKGVSKRNSNYLQQNRHEMTELVADAATLMDAQQPDFLKEILWRAKERRNHRDIIKEKQQDKPLAEQVLAERSSSSEPRR